MKYQSEKELPWHKSSWVLLTQHTPCMSNLPPCPWAIAVLSPDCCCRSNERGSVSNCYRQDSVQSPLESNRRLVALPVCFLSVRKWSSFSKALKLFYFIFFLSRTLVEAGNIRESLMRKETL